MIGTANHDYNSWEGTAREHFEDNLENMTVLSVIGNGSSYGCNGQEGGNDKRGEPKDLSFGVMIPWRRFIPALHAAR